MKTVLAKLQLLPTTKGGRSTPLVPARDFGCPVFFKDVPGLTEHGYDCRFLIRTFGKIIHPGETVRRGAEPPQCAVESPGHHHRPQRCPHGRFPELAPAVA